MGRNIPSSKRGFGWNAKKQRLELYVNGSAVDYWDEPKGRTYYVNNIAGDSTNDGLSWDMAMDEPSTAIAASEAYRVLQGTSTNDYVPNTIIIQGTGTAYTGITDLGERAFILGMSAGLMRDGGSGQVRIGGTISGCDDATNARGNTLYNIQFISSLSAGFSFRNTAWIQRSRFQEVTFMHSGATALTAAFYTANCSGSVFERCRFVENGTAYAAYGFQSAGQFSDNLLYKCFFGVGTTAMFAHGTSNQCTGSSLEECTFQDVGGQTFALGVSDGSSQGNLVVKCCTFGSTSITAPFGRVSDVNNVGNMVAGTADFVSASE